MTAQFLIQLLVLLRDRQMPIVLTPLVDVSDGATEAISGGLEYDNPVTFPGACPIMGESQKVKGTRTIAGWLVPVLP